MSNISAISSNTMSSTTSASTCPAAGGGSVGGVTGAQSLPDPVNSAVDKYMQGFAQDMYTKNMGNNPFGEIQKPKDVDENGDEDDDVADTPPSPFKKC